jgi:hypothetical protein
LVLSSNKASTNSFCSVSCSVDSFVDSFVSSAFSFDFESSSSYSSADSSVFILFSILLLFSVNDDDVDNNVSWSVCSFIFDSIVSCFDQVIDIGLPFKLAEHFDNAFI